MPWRAPSFSFKWFSKPDKSWDLTWSWQTRDLRWTCCRRLTDVIILPDRTEDPRVPTHSQIVIAAPDGHLGAFPPGDRVVLSKREDLSAPVHGLEDSVCVVPLLLSNLLTEEAVIVVAGANCRSESSDFKSLAALKMNSYLIRSVTKHVSLDCIILNKWY